MADPAGVLDGLKGLVMEPLYAFRITKRCPSCGSSWNGWYAKKHMDYCHHCGEELSGGDSPSEVETEESSDESQYDGPRLGEMVKFSVLFGPEGGIGAWPADEGAIYVTPNTAYQYRNGEWVDVEADTENLFRSVATYVDPQEIRRQQQR